MPATINSVCHFALLAQADAAARPDGLAGLLVGPMLPMLVIGLLFYLMVLRPEKKKRNDHTELVSNLKKNDRVQTIGGILGTIVNAPKTGDEVVIKVDESSNTKLRVLRSAISRVDTGEKSNNE